VLRFTEGQVLEDLEWVLGAIRLASEPHPLLLNRDLRLP
jgi:hypothetical protein